MTNGWGLLESLRMEAIWQKDQPCDQRGQRLEVELITCGQWFHQSRLCKEASVKPPAKGVWRISGLEIPTQKVPGWGVHSGHQVPHAYPIPCPMRLFHLAVKLVNLLLSSVSHSHTLSDLNRGSQAHLIYKQPMRSTGDSLALWWASGVRVGGVGVWRRQSWRTELSSVGSGTNPR